MFVLDFWLGLIGGLLCLTAFSAGIYYCWKAKRNANRNRETRLATITQNNTVSEVKQFFLSCQPFN